MVSYNLDDYECTIDFILALESDGWTRADAIAAAAATAADGQRLAIERLEATLKSVISRDE